MPGTTPNLQLPYPTPDDTVDVPRDVKALADALDPLGSVPVGAFMMWPTAVAPLNWLLMQGQKVAASLYPQLAALLGQDANGLVTITDMRDVFPAGAGPTMALGQAGGAASVALGVTNLPAHNHGGKTLVTDRSMAHLHPVTDPGSGGVCVGTQWFNGAFANFQLAGAGGAGWMTVDGPTGTAGSPDHMHGITSEGGNIAHENRPPFRAVNFIIRAG